MRNSTSTNSGARSARTLTATIGIALGALIVLGTLGATVPMLLNPFQDTWNGSADLITAKLPFEQDLEVPDSEPGSIYSGAVVTSEEPLVTPRLLQAGQNLLTLLVMYAAGGVLLLLSVQLLRHRSFARTLRLGLIALGTLILLSSAVGPQLGALSTDLGIRELGVPVFSADGDGVLTAETPDTVMLHLWDPLWILSRVDLIPFLLGTVLAMIGFLASDGEKLQRDTEGLV